MILLTATRLDVHDRFQFRIEAPECVPVLTSDPVDAVKILVRFGVENPAPLVAHARAWGAIEIPEHRYRKDWHSAK